MAKRVLLGYRNENSDCTFLIALFLGATNLLVMNTEVGSDELAELTEIEELFFAGTDFVGEGDIEQALACFDRCLEVDPAYPDAILGKAMIFLNQEKFDEAIALAKRLVELDSEDPLAFTNLSVFYQRAGRIKEAEEAGATARTLDWKRQLQDEQAEQAEQDEQAGKS